jgi:hypothetical protein
MHTEQLLESTYRLLDASTLTHREISKGANVDINWLAKFKQRAIEEPGVLKVQRVHDFLVGQSRADEKSPGSGAPQAAA